ncbi:MAG: gephyrin-like molybdotransferase Glp [Thermodesulfobacteriota bacterium]
MLTIHEAIEKILAEVKPLGVETVNIQDAAERVLAEDIKATRGNPPWDNSAMDGYAVRAEDVKEASTESPARLKVLYDLAAGGVPEGAVGPGEAVRIMTGAPTPEGADAVVMVEKTRKAEDNIVEILNPVKLGANIRKEGEDFSTGDTVISKGTAIRPAEILMLATTGAATVKVYKKPRVAVLSTGDELVDIDVALSPGKITNSNGYALTSLAIDAGAECLNLGIAGDNREVLNEKFTEAAEFDCIISSGGVSVGDYDLVKEVMRDLGSEMKFWKVALKPGKPLAFGLIGGKPVFGLPGNPVSSMVAFEQFVRPALLKMAGRSDIFKKTFPARLTESIKKRPGRVNFLRGTLSSSGGEYLATPLQGQGSGMITSMVRAEVFIIVPEESSEVKAGETVLIQPIGNAALQSESPDY